MESERIVIALEKSDKLYVAGETIKGTIMLNLLKKSKIRAIKVQLTGKGKCKWMEILRKSSTHNESSTRSLFYSSKEIYAHTETALPEFEPRGIELNMGFHEFKFALPLEWNLPSSFKGRYGSIKYKMRVVIQRPWTFDERYTIPLTIIKHMPLPLCYRTNPRSLEKQVTKTIRLFGTRPISVLAMLPKDYAVLGEPFQVFATVNNNSTTHVEKLKFTVLQYVCYYSHLPLRVQKLEVIQIMDKETGAVQKKSERSFEHELMLPATVLPTDEEFSGVINISYELRVEAVLRGLFKNIVVNLPFKMYLSGGMQQPQLNGNNALRNSVIIRNSSDNAAAGNPFEQSHSLPVYPALDTSIGSPTHSTQLSESSSIHSTTSDSSAATLSPGIAGMTLSYASDSSSQVNSPSARASMRSCNVPYMPYTSSPMVNSYPPQNLSDQTTACVALADSCEYTRMPPTRNSMTTPPLNPLTSLNSFLQPRQPADANDLPPSYEELFGSATAPPDTPK